MIIDAGVFNGFLQSLMVPLILAAGVSAIFALFEDVTR